jgi:activator of Hsp90 ATPase-like protein
MSDRRERVTSSLRSGIAAMVDVATVTGAFVAMLRFYSHGDTPHPRDRNLDRSDAFRELFGAALAEFDRNITAWNRGMTDRQVAALRALCRDNGVAFDPVHYSQIDTGQFVGWIGGPSYAKPRLAGGTLYVGVDRQGHVTGIGGAIVHTNQQQEPSKVTDVQHAPDYENVIRINGAPDAVYDAITTPSGLSGWWTRTTGHGETGGELQFFMNTPEPLVIHVDDAARPSRVEWTVTDCPFLTDWVGTRPVFSISPVGDDESEVRFRHVGLTSKLECIDTCTRSWDHFMLSLRDYVESGIGSPMGSEADIARREAQRAQ